MNVFFMARCLDCEWKITVAEYLTRSQKVGSHRATTGHSVHMYLQPAEEEQ